MPLRMESPGAFYLVMNRENAGMNIFMSEWEREKFLEYVGEAVKRHGIKVHTFCLITAHYHFLIETPHAKLSQASNGSTSVIAYILIEREKEQFSPGWGDLSLQGIDGRNQPQLGPAVRHLQSWNRGYA
jgi:REP element-mobilizing transposase RayT